MAKRNLIHRYQLIWRRLRLSIKKTWHRLKLYWRSSWQWLKQHPKWRWGGLAAAFMVVAGGIALAVWALWPRPSYELGSAAALLPEVNQTMAESLKYDLVQKTFTFSSTTGTTVSKDDSSTTTVKVSSSAKASRGVTISDPLNQVDFKMAPTYELATGRQDGDRVVYPLPDGTGWLVDTYQGTGIKENLLLTKSDKNVRSFTYKLNLGDTLAAKLESNGGIGIYGNTIFSGDVTTGSDADAQLLLKARQNAPKDKLLFVIPAPKVVGKNDQVIKGIHAVYGLDGDNLTLTVTGLSAVEYPLAIDPSIYVVTAAQFMAGNNETNINFDVANKLIDKGPTTGARFDSWTTSATMLPTATWAAGAAAAGGYIYTIGGIASTGQVFNSQGINYYTVPDGVTSLTLKLWGAGGGGGGGAHNAAGGTGGGSGYVTQTLTVTPGETLTVYVGGGGGGGAYNSSGNDAGGGGGGGGATAVFRGSTLIALAAGGGGGGGGRNQSSTAATAGGAGGAGGGTNGVAGSNVSTNNGLGGGGGTQSAGGSAGTPISGANQGAVGSQYNGGAGADGRTNNGADGSGAAGGTSANGGSGGNGGVANVSTTRAGGGGGGAGYYGGGGGSGTTSPNSAAAGGGGGGGSSYISGGTSTAGSGANPGNNGDASRNGAGQGGTGGTANNAGGPGADGIAVLTYGTGTSTAQAVNWAQFDTTTGDINSANPGNGACSGWCTASAYNLPAPRSNFSLVAYNGFLYAMGGLDGSGNRQSTVYIAKLGASGEPQLWHPTSTNRNNWVYWYQDSGLSSIRSDFSAVAYNNRLYVVGGRSTSGVVSMVEYADIKPTGQLGSWTTATALPANIYGENVLVYNDRLYVVGGASTVGGTPSANIYYTKLNANGSINPWVSTTSMTAGRMANGGNFATIWGAYIYVSGGCNAQNGNGYCTSINSDTQVASINADGSLDVWRTVGGATDTRTGQVVFAWRDTIYGVGGCSAQNTTTGACTTILSTIVYGAINSDGDASTIDQSVAAGTAPCNGTNPTSCNLPGQTYIGNMLSSAVIVNGYLYVIGGCTNNGCTTVSNNVSWASISSTGDLRAPATCVGSTLRGNVWCVDTTHTLSDSQAAASPVVFNGQIYLVGGLDGGSNTGTILRTTYYADGSIDAWTSQTLSSLNVNSVSYLYAFARANPSSAGTNPGNLYILGGCSSSSGAGCTAYSSNVYKCNIQTSGAIAGCSTTGQRGITAQNDTTTAEGLGIMSGTVYANYVYLIGGTTSSDPDLATVRYAKIDDNNNIVTAGSRGWVMSDKQLAVGRRRSAAFGYNGYLYAVGGYDGDSGQVLADIEFIKINVSDGSLGSSTEAWRSSAVTINQRWGLTVPVSNSYAYVIGGCTVGAAPSDCTTRTDVIQTFQIYNNDSGAPAGYNTSAQAYGTNPNRLGVSATVLDGYLYVAGGCVSTTDCTNAVNTVSYAPLDSYGNVGTWTDTSALPADRAWGKLLSAGGSLYYVGGQDDTATNEQTAVYYATPSSGVLGGWSTASNGLPAARTKFGAASWNNRLYVVGGLDGGAADTTTVYVSPQLNSGGNITSAWSTSGAGFNVARSGAAVVAYANNLYLFGGHDGTNYLSDVQYAQLSPSTGLPVSWSYTTNLPDAVSQADAFAANGYIYLVGGRSSDTSCDPSTLVAPVSANTAIVRDSNGNITSNSNLPTGIGAWFETNQRYSDARYGNAVAYSDGQAYVIGGACLNNSGPSVTSVTTTNTGTGFASDSANHAVNLPSGIQSGDLLLLFLSVDDNVTVNDPDGSNAGWTLLDRLSSPNSGGVTGTIWARLATGSEGSTVTFTSSSSQSASAQVYRIAAGSWTGDISTNGIAVADATGSTTTTPNPPNLTPSWGSANNLWIAYAAGSTYTSVTTYPSGFSNGTHVNGNTGTNGASTATARLSLNAASDDPGTFTMNASNPSVPFTVAIRPNSALTYAGSDEVQQTTLLSQPQVAKYSIMMDTDTDVFPTYWLLNGVDNSIGARWQLKYRSMTNTTTACTSPAMTTWGQDTNFGDVTLMVPGVYTPKDASGNNTNCARFYYFNISVDSSQSYGYPDDVSRGPTITDLTLQFAADPSKRLMHGRTFTGGLQQPDDTPYYAH